MSLKAKNAITKADFEEALNYLGNSVSGTAKATGIPRAYLSDLKNRNVRLRREHENMLRSFLENQGFEGENDEPAGRRDPANKSSHHPALDVTQVMRRSLTIDDALDDDEIAAALDAQVDRDTKLSQLFAKKIARNEGFFDELFNEDGNYTDESKSAINEARRLLAESYFAVGILRGLRGFKAAAPEGDPQTLGEHFSELFGDLTKERDESAEPSAQQEPSPEAKPDEKKPEPEPKLARKKSLAEEFFDS